MLVKFCGFNVLRVCWRRKKILGKIFWTANTICEVNPKYLETVYYHLDLPINYKCTYWTLGLMYLPTPDLYTAGATSFGPTVCGRVAFNFSSAAFLASSLSFTSCDKTTPRQSIFNRCRIGHYRLTRGFLLKGEPPPECIPCNCPLTIKHLLIGEPPPEYIPCNCPLTIKHLLIERADFNNVRRRFYQVLSLQNFFKTVNPEMILDFLKAAAL